MRTVRLSVDDRGQFIHELNKLPQWRDGGTIGERSVLRAAGLPDEFVNSIPLAGIPVVDAPNVIAHLENLGHLASKPTHYALGALVEYLLINVHDLEGKIFLAYLLKRYELVTDLEYQKDLEDRYALFEIPAKDALIDLGWDMAAPTFDWRGPLEAGQLEAIWSRSARFLEASFLEKGAKVARAVCRVENRTIEDINDQALGTGFAVGPNLILTNEHVISENNIEDIQVRFGYRLDESGNLKLGSTYRALKVLRQSPVYELDYALFEVEDSPGDDAAIGYLIPVGRELRINSPVYIIQHPLGDPQKVVLQDNWITYVADNQRRVQYLTNTRGGSSGSPVCNEHWEVVALHHSGAPLPALPSTRHIRGNEGIPMVAILPEIEDLLP